MAVVVVVVLVVLVVEGLMTTLGGGGADDHRGHSQDVDLIQGSGAKVFSSAAGTHMDHYYCMYWPHVHCWANHALLIASHFRCRSMRV